jgi:hypothetical protein
MLSYRLWQRPFLQGFLTHMDKGSGDKHTSTKVLAGEEHALGHLQPLDLLGGDGETSA